MSQEWHRVINVEKTCVRKAYWTCEYEGYFVEVQLEETCDYVEFVVELTDEQKQRLEQMETHFTMKDLEGCSIYADKERNKGDERWTIIGDIPSDIRERLYARLKISEVLGFVPWLNESEGWTLAYGTGYIPESDKMSFYKEEGSES